MGQIKHHENEERRAYCSELRTAESDGRTVEGYAALTDNVTKVLWYNESVARGAFDQANMSDVRALFNHDPNQVLARTASGTLKLEVDDRGLKFRFSLPNTAIGNDLVEMVKRGDVSQCSFAFTVDEQDWKRTEGEEFETRVITKIKEVYDVSLVTYPAYPDTSVALRSKPTKETPKEEQPLHSPGFREDVEFFNRRLSAVK